MLIKNKKCDCKTLNFQDYFKNVNGHYTGLCSYTVPNSSPKLTKIRIQMFEFCWHKII